MLALKLCRPPGCSYPPSVLRPHVAVLFPVYIYIYICICFLCIYVCMYVYVYVCKC